MYKHIKNLSVWIFTTILFVSLFTGVDMHVSAASKTESESNNSFATANSITLGDTMKGKLSNDNDVDYYKITASDSGKISIVFNHTYVENSDQWKVTIFLYEQGEYKEFSTTSIALNGSEIRELPYIGAVKGKNYYIKVEQYYSNDVVGKNYSIETSFKKSEYYEKEPNNVYGTATVIQANKTYSGNVSDYNGDVDYYKFSAQSNGKLLLSFMHDYGTIYHYWIVKVYMYENGQYSQLGDSHYLYLDGNETTNLPYIGVSKGKNYFIKVVQGVSGDDKEGIEYSLKNTFTATDYYERESNDVYASANDMKIGKSYGGNISEYYDQDAYKIITPSAGQLEIKFNHRNVKDSSAWNVHLYRYVNGQYKEVGHKYVTLNTSGTASLGKVKVVANEVYYVLVDGSYSPAIGEEYTVSAQFSLSEVAKVKATSKKKAIKLSWKKQSGHTYQVQIKDGKWKTVKTTTGNQFTIKKIKAKKSYKIRIRSYKKVNGVTYYSAWKTVKAKTK